MTIGYLRADGLCAGPTVASGVAATTVATLWMAVGGQEGPRAVPLRKPYPINDLRGHSPNDHRIDSSLARELLYEMVK